MSEEAGDDYHFYKAEGLKKKYNIEIYGGIFFSIVGIAMMVGMFFRLKGMGVYDNAQSFTQLVPIILVFIPAYGITLLRNGYKELKLFYKASMDGLILDKDGIRGPLALLEGPTREHFRNEGRATFGLKWDGIEQFIVEPIRGRGMAKSPRYYKITIKGGTGGLRDSVYVLRKYFAGLEDEVLNGVKSYLEAERIVINDELLVKKEG